MPHPRVNAVAAHADGRFDATVARLAEYLEIPAISCDEDYFDEVRRLAARIRDDLEQMGLEGARVLELEGALPSVVAECTRAGPDAPTILVYGHLDLQPVMVENWDTDPHKAVIKGDRMFARGAADDMGGWVSHMAALEAWFAVAEAPPCNLKLFIEGEEEIGSPNLERYMDAFPEAFEADVMVLTDTENPSVDVPGLTVSLRGLLEVELTCRAAHADVHSGLWGNMVPDPVMSLIKLIDRLTDEDGRMAVGRVQVPEAWAAQAADVPLDDEVIREGAHLIDGVDPLPHRDKTPAEWMWRQPAVTVVSTTLPTAAQKKNAIRASASATLSIRVPPGVKPADLYEQVAAVLLADPPGGVHVTVRADGTSGEGWLYEPSGPAFPAADLAYERAWGHKLVQVGVGGSIPFVALFGERFGDLPLILNGVMDPLTTAHGPNESMHLGVFRKAIAANVHLYDTLADALG